MLTNENESGKKDAANKVTCQSKHKEGRPCLAKYWKVYPYIIIENQKAFFKFMADVMWGGFVGKHASNDVNQGLGHVPNMEGKSNFLDGRDRALSVSVWREGGSNVLVGRDRASSVSEKRDRSSSVSVGRDGVSNVSIGRDGGSNVSVGRDRVSSVTEERDRASSV